MGGGVRTPKSLGVSTSGWPKTCSHKRFTITRAVSGLVGLAMASASSRRPLPSVNGRRGAVERISRNWRGTVLPGRPGLPRSRMVPFTGLGLSTITIARGGLLGLVAL